LAAAFALAGCGGQEVKEQAAPAQVAPPPAEVAARRPGPLEARLLPPGAVIGSDPDPRAPSLTFQVRETPDRLLDWIRAAANGSDFVLETEMQEGAEYVFSGRARASDQVFTVRVAPGVNGGTTGMVLVAPR
jgi:hypothetical protein